jgi:hypothetical protein
VGDHLDDACACAALAEQAVEVAELVAYVSIRQHTSAYVSIRAANAEKAVEVAELVAFYVSICTFELGKQVN